MTKEDLSVSRKEVACLPQPLMANRTSPLPNSLLPPSQKVSLHVDHSLAMPTMHGHPKCMTRELLFAGQFHQVILLISERLHRHVCRW